VVLVSGFLSDDRWLRDVARERRERSAEFVADVARLLGVDPPESVQRILAVKQRPESAASSAEAPKA
jgi:hypothetical protein